MTPSIDHQVETLMFGTEYGDDQLKAAMGKELRQRLIAAQEEGRPLRVYAGYDPTAPDIHLGHSISMRKLKQFQDFGHHVMFLVGTFTALVGDHSDKLTGRTPRTPEQIADAARSYAEQCFRVLDSERTEVVYNGDWLSMLSLADTVKLASNFTVQQFLARDNFRKRIENGNPIGLHEFLYALLQGHDAMHLRADVQLGATEQLFNIKAGRKIQEANGQKPNIILTIPILVGLDGSDRMSKSKGNTIGLTEVPSEQFGKCMSVSDPTMLQWMKYVTRWPVAEIKSRTKAIETRELHPMEAKKQLAWEIVSTYHGDAAADEARAGFERVFQERKKPKEIPEMAIGAPIKLIDLLISADVPPKALVFSRAEARRLLKQGGVRVNDEKVDDPDLMVEAGTLVRVGKRRFLKLTPA
jgi:tyrosyl-tRNA synthetase